MKSKIQLFYKDFLLGELDFCNGKYIYNSSEFEQVALKKYKGILNYNLTNSENLESEKIFDVFNYYFVSRIKKIKKLCELIKITDKDNDYNILLKYAQLKQDTIGYHIKIKE